MTARTPTSRPLLLALVSSIGLVTACSSPSDENVTGTGGAESASGGTDSGTGGATGGTSGGASGGSSSGGATGGTLSSGGIPSGGEANGGTEPGTGGASPTGGSGASESTGGTEPGGTGGVPATGGGGSDGGECTPDPSGTFVVEGDVVLDRATCLIWMQADVAGHPYAEADSYCEDLSLGGKDDWRLPTAAEAATLFHCEGTFPPIFDVFTANGDGIWTTTESGTIAGDQPKVCGAGQSSGQYYDFGKVGGQNTRCVQGAVTLEDRTDCKTNNQICL